MENTINYVVVYRGSAADVAITPSENRTGGVIGIVGLAYHPETIDCLSDVVTRDGSLLNVMKLERFERKIPPYTNAGKITRVVRAFLQCNAL